MAKINALAVVSRPERTVLILSEMNYEYILNSLKTLSFTEYRTKSQDALDAQGRSFKWNR
jgi:hypothetical protein